MRKPKKEKIASTVLVMRTCDANLRSEHEAAKGFQWPKSGYVAAPDWKPTEKCGGGLHGLLWGEGDARLLNHSPTAKALVVRATENDIVHLDGKVKFPSGHVVFCGTHREAAAFIQNNGGQGKATHYGTATAGNGGTATAGDYGIINIKYWDVNRYRIATGYIGENNLLPNTPYKLNDKHQFTKVEKEA